MKEKEAQKKIILPFGRELRRVSILSWIIQLIPIPVDLLMASWISQAAVKAAEGAVSRVLWLALLLLLLLAGTDVVFSALKICYEWVAAQSVHRCKLRLYRQFLSCSLPRLYASRQGEILERLNADFEKVTQKSLSLLPSFWTGLLKSAIYFLFLAVQNPWLGLILLAISMLQSVPAVIVKKYMQVNYDDCRRIEAELTDFFGESVRGFVTIQLYQLKDWVLARLEEIHRRYTKIGNTTIYTSRAETVMDSFLDYVLQYGTYAIAGVFALFGWASLETGIQAIALSGGLFAAVRTVFSCIPDFAVTQTAQGRLETWFEEEDDGLQRGKSCLDTSKFYVLKGPNGSGKTTLLRQIAGLLESQNEAGFANEFGSDIEKYTGYPHDLCYLAQEDPVFDFSPAELYEMVLDKNADNAWKEAKDFGLPDGRLTGAKLGELSGGERKKVYLALAFALRPGLLLLDEPTNSLDVKSIDILYQKLKARGSGIVMVTHEERFDILADIVYRIEKGEMCCEEKTNLS